MGELKIDLMERFVSKRDLADFRSDFARHQIEDTTHFAEINGKLDVLLSEKAARDGIDHDRAVRGARWYVLLGFTATFVAAVVGAAGSVVANAFFQ